MECQKCGSDRIMIISGKCADLFYASYKSHEIDGYVPDDIGLKDGGDYVDLDYCLECGQIQGEWPISDPDFEDNDTNWTKERI